MSLPTIPITRSESAAAEALGGLPARPPAFVETTVPVTAAQAAFTAREAGPVAPEPIGNSTFDSAPVELLARREKIQSVRKSLGDLVRAMTQTVSTANPLLAILKSDSKALLSSEGFDVAEAQKFLNAVTIVLDGISKK